MACSNQNYCKSHTLVVIHSRSTRKIPSIVFPFYSKRTLKRNYNLLFFFQNESLPHLLLLGHWRRGRSLELLKPGLLLLLHLHLETALLGNLSVRVRKNKYYFTGIQSLCNILPTCPAVCIRLCSAWRIRFSWRLNYYFYCNNTSISRILIIFLKINISHLISSCLSISFLAVSCRRCSISSLKKSWKNKFDGSLARHLL